MKRNSIRIALGLAVILAATLLAIPAAFSDEDGPRGGAIGGVVVAERQRIAGAFVRLIDDERNVVARTTSGRHGFFRFGHVRPGRYLVVAAKRGVGTGRARAGVRPGQVTRVRVVLSP